MKKFLLTFIGMLTLLTSCQEYSEYSEKGSNTYLLPKGAKIQDYRIIDWKVGPRRRQKVTKGFELKVKMPLIAQEDLEKLIKKSSLDSWIAKVKKSDSRGSYTMGYVKVPLIFRGRRAKTPGFVQQIKTLYPRVYYVAAALSTRLEKRACPALNHNLVIKDIEVEDQAMSGSRLLHISPINQTLITKRVEELRPFPNYFNGGKTLAGTYTVEVALYNSELKQTQSNFVQVANKIVVRREMPEAVKGCNYQDIPVHEFKDDDPVKRFHWNKNPMDKKN